MARTFSSKFSKIRCVIDNFVNLLWWRRSLPRSRFYVAFHTLCEKSTYCYCSAFPIPASLSVFTRVFILYTFVRLSMVLFGVISHAEFFPFVRTPLKTLWLPSTLLMQLITLYEFVCHVWSMKYFRAISSCRVITSCGKHKSSLRGKDNFFQREHCQVPPERYEWQS